MKILTIGCLLLGLSSLAAAQTVTEVRAFGGFNTGPARSPFPSTGPSFGVDISARFAGPLSATLGYAQNRIGSGTTRVCQSAVCVDIESKVKLHEILGGLRLSSSRHISPYVEIGAGLVSPNEARTTTFSASALSLSASVTKLAVSSAGGINVGLKNKFFLFGDVRIVKPRDMRWYIRPALGLGWRF